MRVRGLDTPPYPQEVDPRRIVVNRDIATYKTDKWIDCVTEKIGPRRATRTEVRAASLYPDIISVMP